MEQPIKRLERLTAILIQLQSKSVVKAQEIADRFDISLRTVYRDIRALELAGIPIASEAGYGYSIIEGYHLPPVMFSEDEAYALLIGHKIIERFTDESIRKNHQSALLKVQAILKNGEKDQLEILDKQTQVFVRKGPPKNETEHLAVIQRAIAEKKKLSLYYLSGYKNEYTNRVVAPIGLMYCSGAWHLIAWCELREEYRDFNTRRIQKALLTRDRYYPSKLISMDTYFEQLSAKDKLLEITIKIKKEVYHFMATQKYYLGFVEDKEFEDYYEVDFINAELDYFGRTMLMFGSAVTIVKPAALVSVMKSLVEELKANNEL